MLEETQNTGKTKAIEHYEKFLQLWKEADPGIAEVEAGRERVAGLKRWVRVKLLRRTINLDFFI